MDKHDRVVVGNAFLAPEEDKLLDGVTLLDFDMLCSTVAMQTQGKWPNLDTTQDPATAPEFGGVFRMWEGELLDCYDDRRIAIESAWLDFLNPPFLLSVHLFLGFFFSFICSFHQRVLLPSFCFPF